MSMSGWIGRQFRPRRVAAAGAAAVVVIGGAAVSFGAVPDATGKINGCYASSATSGGTGGSAGGAGGAAGGATGALRVIDTAKGQTCTTGEAPISWGAVGPQGPTGPTGPRGPIG